MKARETRLAARPGWDWWLRSVREDMLRTGHDDDVYRTVFSNTLTPTGDSDSQELRAAGPALIAVTGNIYLQTHAASPCCPCPSTTPRAPGPYPHPRDQRRNRTPHTKTAQTSSHTLAQVRAKPLSSSRTSEYKQIPGIQLAPGNQTTPSPPKRTHNSIPTVHDWLQNQSIHSNPLFSPVMYKKTSTHHHHYHRFAPTPPPHDPSLSRSCLVVVVLVVGPTSTQLT